jgi:hypothetical protein
MRFRFAGAPLMDPSCDNITNPCLGNVTAVYSDPSTLNATSIRIDYRVTAKITLFVRYNHAPSYDARQWCRTFDRESPILSAISLMESPL